MKNCPCGSKQAYQKCCSAYISGEKMPDTAEALMRSRYTAYTEANIPYIETTARGPAAQWFNPTEALEFATKAKWKRLKVLDSYPHPTNTNRAYVQFSAYYIYEGKPQEMTETSEFERIDGRWYYVDSDHHGEVHHHDESGSCCPH